MNKFTFDSSWNQMKGQLRQKYGQLTDDDLSLAEGQGEELLGRLQEKLGVSKTALHSTLNEIRDSLDETHGSFRERIEQAGAKAVEVAGDLKTRAGEVADEMKTAAAHKAGEVYEQARQRARTVHDDAEEYVRQNPRESMLGALAAGFVVGLILKR